MSSVPLQLRVGGSLFDIPLSHSYSWHIGNTHVLLSPISIKCSVAKKVTMCWSESKDRFTFITKLPVSTSYKRNFIHLFITPQRQHKHTK